MNRKVRFAALILTVAIIGCATVPDEQISLVQAPVEQPVTETEEEVSSETSLSSFLSTLSLRQRIGQRFIGWIPRDGIDSETKALVQRGEVGGFILYPWNYESLEDAKTLVAELRQDAGENGTGIPLFFTADQEGGRVAAFRFPEFVQLPAAFHLARIGDPGAVEAAAYVNAVQLRSIGVNLNLAPVLDLYAKPDRTIIGDRSFGADAEITSGMGKSYVEGTLRGGVLPVIKHFPGHGLSTVDSHGDLPVIDTLDAEVLREHIAPFRAAIEAGAPAVMPAHLLFPEIDPIYPVTLSDIFILELLRGELGFDGLIVSDGLAMGALSKHYTLEETLARCFQVGIDVILVHSRYDINELIDTVVSLIENGKVSRSRIDEGLLRVLAAKRSAGML